MLKNDATVARAIRRRTRPIGPRLFSYVCDISCTGQRRITRRITSFAEERRVSEWIPRPSISTFYVSRVPGLFREFHYPRIYHRSVRRVRFPVTRDAVPGSLKRMKRSVSLSPPLPLLPPLLPPRLLRRGSFLFRGYATRGPGNANRKPEASSAKAAGTMTFQRGYRGSGESVAGTGGLCTRGTNRRTDIRSYIRGNIGIERDIGARRRRSRGRPRRRGEPRADSL